MCIQPKPLPSLSATRVPFWLTTAGARLTANIIKLWGLSLCGVQLKAYRAEFFGGSLQLPCVCKCSLRWNFSISLLHSSTPPPPIESQPAAVQRTVSSVHRGGQGSFQAAVNSSFCLGKRFMSIQTTGAVSFLTTSVKRGQSNTQLPLSCVCHNYSEGQPFPWSD